MHDENINHAFLDGVLAGEHVDVYYHFGVASDDPVLEGFRDVRAIILAGSGDRIDEFAQRWSALHGDAPVVALPKEERFVTRYCAGVLFASHGMGMPSASIAVQELMRMVFFLKGGDLEAMSEVFWARVGTSGGVGLPGGTVVVTTEGVMADLGPYRLLKGGSGEYRFDSTFPLDVAEAIVAASAGSGHPGRARPDGGRQRVLPRAVPPRRRGLHGDPGVEDGLAGVDQRRGRAQHRDGGRDARRLPQPLGLPEVRDDLHDAAQPARGRPGDAPATRSCTRTASAPGTCCSTT